MTHTSRHQKGMNKKQKKNQKVINNRKLRSKKILFNFLFEGITNEYPKVGVNDIEDANSFFYQMK